MMKFKKIKAGEYKNDFFEIRYNRAYATSGGFKHGAVWKIRTSSKYGSVYIGSENTLKEAKEEAERTYEEGYVKTDFGKIFYFEKNECEVLSE